MRWLRIALKFILSIVSKKRYGVAVILVAIFLRIYRLSEFVTFLGDQGRDATIIKRILTLEHLPAIGPPTSIGQVYLGPFYYYLMAPFLFISRFNPLGLALGVAFISILGLVFVYIVVKKIIDEKTAVFFLVFIAFSSTLIDLARFSWNPNLLPLFSFLTLFFFFQLSKTRKNIYAILCGSFFSFSIQLHYLGVFLIVPMFFHLLVKRGNLKALWKKLLLASLSFILFSSPLFLFDIRHNFLNSRNFITFFSTQSVVSRQSLFTRFLETNQQFFNHILKLNIVPLFAFFLFLLTFLLFWRSSRKNDFLHIHFINMISFTPLFSLLNSPRHPHYYAPLYYSFFLLLGYSLSRNGRLLIGLLIVLYIILNAQKYYFFFNKPNNQIETAYKIAQSILARNPKTPYQTLAVPHAETDGHIRYFLETAAKPPLPENSPIQPEELYVLCFAKQCGVIGNPQWQIAAFQKATINSYWYADGVTIYQLIHAK